ncbi:MAG: bifunctional aspartate kinase/homoserine dehydrogenase I [Chitinophagales bacterium]|nr:bifunctional aspartate kinase/homoserine dehydrogenase I [Chitinophagales bacterium]
MQVLKFGGTSVGNAANINKVIAITQQKMATKTVVLVVSALGGTTDKLIEAGRTAAAGNEDYKNMVAAIEDRHLTAVQGLLPSAEQADVLNMVKTRCREIESICSGIFLLGELTPRALDKLMSFGEVLSSQIISAALTARGIENVYADSQQLIQTNSNFGNAQVNFETTDKNIAAFVKNNPSKLYVAPGFIAATKDGVTTTLGRGGSDYTAAIFAAALNVSALEIWTDVSGMMTADPRIVSNARIIPNVSYQVAMELSHFGAKVIYPPTIQPVKAKSIPTWIKNTFVPDDYGTLIEEKSGSTDIVNGISSIGKIALLLLEGSGMVGIPGFSARLFSALASQKINVILITQSSSEHSICVAIDEANLNAAKEAVDSEFSVEIALQKIEPLASETNLAIVALVGDNMEHHPGISGRMFGALGKNGINIRAIAQGSSEKNISAVISSADVKKAVNVLHEEFFENISKQVNLFIAGVGNVGSRLMQQLQNQKEFVREQLGLQIRIAGISSSRKMLLNEEGISLENWKESLNIGEEMNLGNFIAFIKKKNLRNSIFVDMTANEQVASVYKELLQKSISVVACNKIAASSAYENYRQLKNLAREYQSSFLFETNVGAGLPVIGTLNDLIRSGDKILKIQAVLSGTLNFVFNHYDGTKTFSSVVKQAQEEGYTEPDPRLDLSGTDVMRKILILAREAGLKMEMSDITNNGFLPASCMNGNVDDFYKEMEKHEAHFKKLYADAASQNCKLKFVAQLAGGKASVGLQQINAEHNLYHLYGKDNAVLFYTERYPEQPLVIKGAGAGADVTASGVFADIMRAAKV